MNSLPVLFGWAQGLGGTSEGTGINIKAAFPGLNLWVRGKRLQGDAKVIYFVQGGSFSLYQSLYFKKSSDRVQLHRDNPDYSLMPTSNQLMQQRSGGVSCCLRMKLQYCSPRWCTVCLVFMCQLEDVS